MTLLHGMVVGEQGLQRLEGWHAMCLYLWGQVEAVLEHMVDGGRTMAGNALFSRLDGGCCGDWIQRCRS